RRPHVLGHALGAADEERGAVLDPIDDIAALFPDAVLDVGLVGGIAREGEIESRQRAVLERILPFELMEKIVGEMAVAEEQPVAPTRPGCAALLNKGAERRDAGSWPHHDDVAGGRGQGEVLVGAKLDADAAALLQPLGDEIRSNALAGTA